MEANTTTASAAIPSTPRITPGRTTEGVQSRGDQGNSSAAFSQRTNVTIDTAIDHMADILSKVSGRQQTNVQQMPQELKEVIQNMIRQSFSIETTLGQGLGSTAASQRFSTDQLTTLARMLNQLGSMAETEGSIPRVSDDLAALLTGLKTALTKEYGGTFEPIMLTKAAFQLLDTGNAELLPKELQEFLTQLNVASGSPSGTTSSSLTFLNQLVQLLMPRGTENNTQQMPANGNISNAETSSTSQNSMGGSSVLAHNTGATMSEDVPPEQQMPRQQTSMPGTDAVAKENPSGTPRQTGSVSQEIVGKMSEPPAQGQPSSSAEPDSTQKSMTNKPSQMGTNSMERGQNSAPPTGNTQNALSGKESQSIVENKSALESNVRPAGSPEAQSQSAKSNMQAGHDTELANTAKTSAQNVAQVRSPEMQNTIPRFVTQTMENTPQTMNVLRNLAQALLQNENLSQREVLLLQNFVNGRGQTMSEGDAKQLQQLIQLTQQNIPGTVRQAALEQQLPDLPRLWAFMQMADIVKTRRMTAEQYKRAGRDVAALALTMRNALEGENATPQPGQRSMNFVMPLFMGASEYPAYIHVYDESHTDEETDRLKKETWLRICVLTDNIGTVELINRIYEENHVDMRLYFSDADAAWEFRNALDSIRESADGTALIIEGIQIGAIGERRFFTN
ncbi:hypothetical protein [Selenomonas sp. oral taxon 920]|uniref:hypothetical protein n=1 Tax=Selenomonas sp. oral taxon 920 TaxID=1884263 RepID=UPI000B1292E8|nr:hypothetical protein [Selenomonas sp. oral taxon 920]